MQLCYQDIIEAIKEGSIGFIGPNSKHPFRMEKQIQPASIDLRLDPTIVKFSKSIKAYDIKKDTIDTNKDLVIKHYRDGQAITIEPGEMIFGQIYEQMWIGDLFSARVEGRSRVARLGLSVHCTGSYINPGFCGAMPLQIINHNRFPVTIYPYVDICQLAIYRLSNEPKLKYSELPRAYHPYYDEKIASPSVLKSPSDEEDTFVSVQESRMRMLVTEYYNSHENRRKPMEESKVDKIVHQNIQNINAQTVNQNVQQDSSGTMSSVINYDSNDSIDYTQLLSELEQVKQAIKSKPNASEEDDILLGEVTKAAQETKKGNKSKALQMITECGNKLYDIVKTIGCALLSEYLKQQLGIKP